MDRTGGETAFDLVEFAENPEPRCAVVLLLDASGSMQGARIAQLNSGLRGLDAALRRDPLASLRVELAPFGVPVSIVEPASIRSRIWEKGAARADELGSEFAPEVAALYADRVARFREVALSRGPGADPADVAKAVEHALTASRPKARYLVGRDAHVRAWVERLPTRLRDRLLAKKLTG